MSLSSLSLTATQIAIRASGADIQLQQPIGTGMAPRVALESYPSPSDVGWSTGESGACHMVVQLRADLNRRTAYLVIDRDTAPLTGNYIVQAGDGGGVAVSTYNATAGAPADVDELLAAIVVQLTTNLSAYLVADVYSTEPGGDSDCIRVRFVVADGRLSISTAFPPAADLAIYAEYQTLTALELYGRAAPHILPAASQGSAYSDMTSAWTLVSDITATLPNGEVPRGGYMQRIDTSGMSAVMARVVGATLPDDVAGVTGLCAVYFCPAVSP